MIFLVLNYVACLPVILAVGVFSLYHLWAVLSNTTTIEGWEKEKARELRRKGRIQQFSYPFSLGVYRNLQAVLGPNPLLWWLPQKMTGDGLQYSTPPTLDPLEQYLWPPRDLFTRRAPQIRRRQMEMEAFTYGDERLNPDLQPNGGTRRVVEHRTVSPYHPDYEDEDGVDEEWSSGRRGADGDEMDCSGSGDEEEPLGVLLARRNRRRALLGAQEQIVRRPLVRRGSEGIEIKPGPSWGLDHGLPPSDAWLDSGSEASDGWN